MSVETRSDGGLANVRQSSPQREPGDRINGYIVLESIGTGGMGVVYSAYDPKLDRKVALKLLHDDGADEGATVGRLRLLAEGRALARVSHPNIVAVYDVGKVDEDAVYIAMELVVGQTLKQWRDAKPHSWEEVVDKFLDISAGLIAVHEANMIHRDVKPDNVLIDESGRARVTDFGLARPHEHAPPSLARAERELIREAPEGSDLQLTRTGAKIGTPAYMASEQLQGKDATASSDQFAFCVALWECLYGTRPFEGTSWVSLVMEVSEGRLRDPPPPPSGRPVPTWLRRLVERGLRADPKQRWPSMQELRAALLEGDPLRRRKRVALGVTTLALAGAGAGAVQMHRSAEHAEAIEACATEGERVHEVWSSEARERLRSRFAASKIEGAPEIGSSVAEVLDTYAQQWAQARTQACVAKLDTRQPTPGGVLDRREECLDNSLATVDGFLDSVVEGHDAMGSRARFTAETTANLDACNDDERLLRQPDLPEDAKLRERVRELRRTLSSTILHEHLGDYDEGLRISETALGDARETGHGPLIANGLYRVAVFHEKLGDYEQAVQFWVDAFHEAALSENEMLAAQAAMALSFTEGYHLERHNTGQRWSELAGTYIERLELKQTLFEARRLDVLAVLHEMQGDLEGAVRIHRSSLALRRSLVPDTHQSLGYGLANLAGVLRTLGKLEEAEASLLESKRIFENAFGKDNPTTAQVLNNLSGLYQELERYDEAVALLDRVGPILREHLGPEHPDVGDVHRSLGDIALAQADLPRALSEHQKALEIHRAAYAKPHGDVSRSSLAVARDHLLRGELDPAHAQYQQALEVITQLDRHRDRGEAEHDLGTIALLRNDVDRARAHFSRARVEFESTDDPSKHWLSRVDVGLAAVEMARTASSEAHAKLEALALDDASDTRARALAIAWSKRLRTPAPSHLQAPLDALLHDASTQTRSLVALIETPPAVSPQ